MAIYHYQDKQLKPITGTTFATHSIKERQDLQRLLREQVEIISRDTLVIAEEFGDWDDSRRRIDLLGIDKNASLVVIELKRTDDGGHMELQAIRYAAMVSSLTFSQAVEIFSRHLQKLGKEEDAQSCLLEFLDWDEVHEEDFAKDVKIVLASAEFSKELTTAVLWLNNNGLDIKCIRLKPYDYQGQILLDVQQVIPLPETEEYLVSVRNKTLKEKGERLQSRDFTKYTVQIGDVTLEKLPKRRAIFHLAKYLCEQGVEPDSISEVVTWRSKIFRSVDGILSGPEFEVALAGQLKAEGIKTGPNRFFIEDDELIYSGGRTYAFSKMWGARTPEAMKLLKERFPDYQIGYKEYL